MYGILQEKYYNIGNSVRYLAQTRSHTRSSGIKLSEIHGISKGLDPNVNFKLLAYYLYMALWVLDTYYEYLS